MKTHNIGQEGILSENYDSSSYQQFHFAVFGDIHGRIALMYTIALLWQKHFDIQLTALLQVGDMGAFPDLSRLDASTRKHAERDPDELGFQLFTRPTVEGAHYLNRNGSPSTYFIRGNHEDFDYLGEFKDVSPLDPWSRIWYIPDGKTKVLEPKEGQKVKIGGLGGISPGNEIRKRGRNNRNKHRRSKHNSDNDPRYFNQDLIHSAKERLKGTDILLTHAGPYSDDFPTGSHLLTDLAREIKPRVHLFGHHHKIVFPCPGPGNSLMVGLEHLEFTDEDTLRYGSCGILSVTGDSASFSFLSPDSLPSIKDVQRYSYRALLEKHQL